jgi:hypothetical protein
MFARLFAFVCISQFALCSSLPGPVITRKQTLVVFLKGAADQSAASLLEMKQETRKLLKPTGYDIEFLTTLDGSPITGRLVVAEFKGQCSVGEAPHDSSEGLDLATTAVANGHILPFSELHCAVLSHLLAPALSYVPSAKRESLLGRSLGRILAHELFHILADEPGHENEGVAKRSFSAQDLLSKHFSFEERALDRIAAMKIPAELPRRGTTD